MIQEPVLIPAECRVDPVAAQPVDEPALLPEIGAPEAIARAQRANMAQAFLYWRERTSAAEEALNVNAGAQRACAQWARARDGLDGGRRER